MGLRGGGSANRFDVGVDADNDGFAVDRGFGFLVAIAAGDGKRFAGGGRTRRVQRDFDVEDVVLDGGFHGIMSLLVFSFQCSGEIGGMRMSLSASIHSTGWKTSPGMMVRMRTCVVS